MNKNPAKQPWWLPLSTHDLLYGNKRKLIIFWMTYTSCLIACSDMALLQKSSWCQEGLIVPSESGSSTQMQMKWKKKSGGVGEANTEAKVDD